MSADKRAVSSNGLRFESTNEIKVNSKCLLRSQKLRIGA
jgi:hypothetical protein